MEWGRAADCIFPLFRFDLCVLSPRVLTKAVGCGDLILGFRGPAQRQRRLSGDARHPWSRGQLAERVTG